MLQRNQKKLYINSRIFMSHYLQQNPQRFYSTTYEYQPSTNQHFSQHSQRNTIVIRDSSINRNNSVCDSFVFKQASIHQNIGKKIRKQSNLRSGVEFKENDPLANNSLLNNSNPNRMGIKKQRDSMEFVSQYDSKGSYFNPLSVKRDNNNQEISRQKVVTQKILNEKNSSNLGNDDKKFEVLNERLGKLQEVVYSLQSRGDHQQQVKQKYSDPQHPTPSKPPSSKHLRHQSRNSRSISSLNSTAPSFKQLSQIMSLIQQSKKYQIKNSEQYRKMIEQFRMTLLEFREELNETVKRSELEGQIGRVREVVVANNVKLSVSNNNSSNSQHATLSPKSSLTELYSTASGPSSSISQHQSQTASQIQSQIHALKLAIQKLQENAISLKADMVKCNVREKKFIDEVSAGLGEMGRRVNYLEREWVPFDGVRRGGKWEGKAVCFKVAHEITVMPMAPKPPLLSRSAHMSSSSLDQRHLQSSLATSHLHKPLSPSSSSSCPQPITSHSTTYYIDSSGYLLDKDNFYLLNEKNQQIRLSDKQISMLKKLKVLQ